MTLRNGILPLFLAALLSLSGARPPSITERLNRALERSAELGYTFQVRGRYLRDGIHLETPTAILTSRIRVYRIARIDQRLFYKGTSGLWREAGKLEVKRGEATENPDSDAFKILKVLFNARPPHEKIPKLLDRTVRASAGKIRKDNDIPCRSWTLQYDKEMLQAWFKSRIEESIKESEIEPPEEIQWKSARGTLVAFLHRETELPVRFVDERTIRLKYKKDGVLVSHTYRTNMTYVFLKVGETKPELPEPVEKALKKR